MFSRLRRRHDVGRRERLVELFNRMDCNGDRILHMNEVNEYLQRHRYDPSAIRSFDRKPPQTQLPAADKYFSLMLGIGYHVCFESQDT
ncbi:hypothetical protein TSMEX_001587 [Taenia solium]|eukprot:TsM_001000100 transcript=TsM_001000100 gene=TsM_001000100